MAQVKISETYEDKRDPQFINVAALEAERNLISKLFKRDRRRMWREWAQTGVIALLAFVVYDQATSNKVVAYRIEEGLDGTERADFIKPYTVNGSVIARESRQWLEFVRIVSSDKVVQDKMHNAAVKQMDTVTLKQQITAYITNQVIMPAKGTRDVLEDTFGFTQLSSGEEGLYTFIWKWYEQESFAFVPSTGFEMQATVTMKVRPPTRKEIRDGKMDGLFVSYFNIRPVRQLTIEELDRIVTRK